ncbi:FeS assembly protein SufB [Aeropyrum pernix K1]|uniref:FeS assembly protein SufB n=1 Tax=Aeropyrum pernix (strain ATCC 700893 / DSM 11879 / JCM 9820 / NBRC 100138 / K1) TaxID=272557 RepID=Q9YB94_AERPE|nr:Fe-S cluster assembly protein SufB [Aeropyrum pernix]BAA80704.1 FeS assembly protein SufB [Aeropyrum pernix K1]
MGEMVELKKELLRDVDLAERLLGRERPVKSEIEIRGKITRSTIEEISRIKKEPEWMKRLRLRSLELFYKLPTPKWLVGIDVIDLDEMIVYSKPETERASSWEELPKEIREFYERLGLPEIEARFLSGLSAVFDSETVYARVKKYLEEKGVIVMPIEEAVQKYPDLVKRYFMRVFPPSDHKFAALHGALWSGGTFIYVPRGVKIREPIESFFLIGKSGEGQFEHSLIVADEGAYVEWIEGCSAPRLTKFSFHDGMVEAYAHRNATIKIITVQNWSKDVINLNNKRAIAEEGARVDWVEGSIGSKMTFVYPSTILKGDNSSSRSAVVTIAKGPYLKDSGSKMIHVGRNTRSQVINKTISADGGINVYRGIIRIVKGARNAVANVECESLILDDKSKAHTYPHNQVDEPTASVNHEATTGRLTEPQLFYLTSRGLTEEEAKSLIVLGFLEDVLKELPFEYANVLTKVVRLEFSEYGAFG